MATVCPQCEYLCAPGAAVCSLCGSLLRPEAGDPFVLPDPARPAAPPPPPAPRARVPVGWKHLIVGSVLALGLTLTPTLRFLGWLLGSLFHETGHVAFAWFVGCPAFPAIRLDGHAAAFHKPQETTVVLLVGAILVVLTALAWKHRRLRALATSALVLWPLFAFVDTPRELGFLLSGHLAELVFAGVFLWRARTGEAVEREAERPLYACLGWFLVVRNVVLAGSLAFEAAARAQYLTSGSFGLLNDYARVAFHVLGVPLEAVALFMLLVSLAVFPVVLALTWNAGRPTFRYRPQAAAGSYRVPAVR